MNLGNQQPRVVMLYDNVDDIRGASQIVSTFGDEYRAVVMSQQETGFLIRTKPVVLLMALSSVERAVEYYSDLMEKKHLSYPHYIIILCANREEHIAFQSCMIGLFDEYFVYQPLYEKLRLVMMVQRGLEVCGVEREEQKFDDSIVDPIEELLLEKIEEAGDHKALEIESISPINIRLERHKLLRGEETAVPSGDNDVENSKTMLESLEPAIKNSIKELIKTLYLHRSGIKEEEQALSNVSACKGDSTEFFDFADDDGFEQHDMENVPEPHRVLVVEDNELYRDMLVSVLRGEGFDVDEAHDGAIALDKVKDSEYDVILMDLFMPKLDGLNATKQLRKLSKRKDMPIIALTGNTNKDVIRKWASYGLKGYIIKPSNREQIIACVEKAVAL